MKFPNGTATLDRALAAIQDHRVLVGIVVSTASIRILITISFHPVTIQANSIGEVKTENFYVRLF
jgi:hypothetical protein